MTSAADGEQKEEAEAYTAKRVEDRLDTDAVQQPDTAHDRGAVNRCGEHEGGAGDGRCGAAHLVHPPMITVAVAAVGVIHGENVGSFGLQDERNFRRGLFRVSGAERARWGLDRLSEARIAVIQTVDANYAQNLGGPVQLIQPLAAQIARWPSQPESSGCRHDEHDAVPFGRRLGERAAGEQRFVIRVGVKGD